MSEADVETMNVDTGITTIKARIIVAKIDGPLSSGHLELKNTNPDDNPSVTFNYFREPEDLNKCAEGMKTLISVVTLDAFSKFRFREVSVQALLNLIEKLPMNLRPRNVSATISLGPYGITMEVAKLKEWLHHEYKVLGVDALRAIDGCLEGTWEIGFYMLDFPRKREEKTNLRLS